jgi:fumarate reductase flavoprotein subunit
MSDHSDKPNISEKKQMITEVVVVGGGLSGLAAALTAAENGVKVVLLEKLRFPGGAGIWPEGSLGIGTRYQRENGISTTVEQVFSKVMEFHHWRCNAGVIRTLLNESGNTIDWLEEHGAEIHGIKTVFPPEKSLQTWHIFEGHGARVVKIMAAALEERGGTLLTSSPVDRLLFDEAGRIIGVEGTTADGTAIVVEAEAVVLATGGFAANKEMLKEFVPDVSSPGMAKLMCRGPVIDGRTGDGINLALSANAALAGMQTLAGNSPYLDYEPAIRQFSGPDHLKQVRCALVQPFLWINNLGERFYNESYGSVFSDVYNAMTSNGGLMWSIFDQKMYESMVEHGPIIPFNAIVVPGQKMTGLAKGIQMGLDAGFAFTADTLEGLAAKIDIEPEKLRGEVEKINRFAAQGRDPEYNRNPEHLIPFDLHQGPYYALKGLRAFFLTLGGVRINENMQAVDRDGQIIQGLYVTGQDMGGLYDTTYDLLAEGSASSFALSSGRIAVKHIIRDRLGRAL